MTGNDRTVSPVTFVNPAVSSCVGRAVFMVLSRSLLKGIRWCQGMIRVGRNAKASTVSKPRAALERGGVTEDQKNTRIAILKDMWGMSRASSTVSRWL